MSPGEGLDEVLAELRACRICRDAPLYLPPLPHQPRPVIQAAATARLCIAGQAPGTRVHASGRPFTDPSGDRLRDWTGLTEAEFYDLSRVAVVPMAFCFPGYDAKGSDLPPPPLCAATWRGRVMQALPRVRLVLAVGGAAIGWHLGRGPVAGQVAGWRAALDRGVFPLPHPSWRNTAWLKRHPWFEAELVPELRARVRAVMETE